MLPTPFPLEIEISSLVDTQSDNPNIKNEKYNSYKDRCIVYVQDYAKKLCDLLDESKNASLSQNNFCKVLNVYWNSTSKRNRLHLCPSECTVGDYAVLCIKVKS